MFHLPRSAKAGFCSGREGLISMIRLHNAARRRHMHTCVARSAFSRKKRISPDALLANAEAFESAELPATKKKHASKPSSTCKKTAPSTPVKEKPGAEVRSPIKQEKAPETPAPDSLHDEIIKFHTEATARGVNLDLNKLLTYADAHFGEEYGKAEPDFPRTLTRLEAALRPPMPAAAVEKVSPPEAIKPPSSIAAKKTDPEADREQRRYFDLGYQACQSGHYSAAIPNFEKALEIPGSMDRSAVSAFLGSCLLYSGRMPEGVEILRSAFLSVPTDAKIALDLRMFFLQAWRKLVRVQGKTSDAADVILLWSVWAKTIGAHSPERRAKKL